MIPDKFKKFIEKKINESNIKINCFPKLNDRMQKMSLLVFSKTLNQFPHRKGDLNFWSVLQRKLNISL